jgi:hypothetical protein
MGGLNGLTKLNVIQRERLAASIGLSAAELTNAAREQEVLNKLGFQNKQALEEQYELMRQRNDVAGMAALKAEAEKTEQGKVLLQDIARANLQQRFQESVERIKQIFTEIAAGPIIKMLEGLARLLQNTTALKGIFAVLTGLAAMLAVKIAMATGGLSLLIGGLAAAGVMGSGLASYGSNDQYTPGPTALPAVSQTAAASSAASLNNRRDLEQRMSSMTPAMATTPTSIAPVSPEMATVPQVPYSTNTATPQPTGAGNMDTAANTSQNKVIQNNIVLTLDGIAVTTAQKKVDVSYA